MGNLKTLLAGVCMFSCICVSAQTGKFLGEISRRDMDIKVWMSGRTMW